jgi:hypothetical protein
MKVPEPENGTVVPGTKKVTVSVSVILTKKSRVTSGISQKAGMVTRKDI